MKITYTGMQAELLPKDRKKLEGKLAKVGKIIERRGEKEAHVILSQERHLHHAEITLNVYDHAMVGVGSDSDVVTAVSAAIEKLEKQILKLRTKRRDTYRQKAAKPAVEPVMTPPPSKTAAQKKASQKAASAQKPSQKVFRVNHQEGRKPMTLEEAMLEMNDGHDYLVYRDANTDRVCTLLRRSDGHLDLIES